MAVAQHDSPIKTVHFIKGANYTCIMTGSWDKTIKVFLKYFELILINCFNCQTVMGFAIESTGNDSQSPGAGLLR